MATVYSQGGLRWQHGTCVNQEIRTANNVQETSPHCCETWLGCPLIISLLHPEKEISGISFLLISHSQLFCYVAPWECVCILLTLFGLFYKCHTLDSYPFFGTFCITLNYFFNWQTLWWTKNVSTSWQGCFSTFYLPLFFFLKMCDILPLLVRLAGLQKITDNMIYSYIYVGMDMWGSNCTIFWLSAFV